MVSLRDADSMPAGVVRAYVSELYQDVYDAACAARRPHLDVRVLLPVAAISVSDGCGVRGGSSSSSPSFVHASPAPSDASPVYGSRSTVIAPATASSAAASSAAGVGNSAVVADLTTSVTNAGWATREAAEMEPDLEVLFSDEPQRSGHQAALNADRIRAGAPPVDVVSLEYVAKRAYNPEYFYAEDVTADIPTFSSVSAA